MRIGWVWVTHDEDEVPVDEVRTLGAGHGSTAHPLLELLPPSTDPEAKAEAKR